MKKSRKAFMWLFMLNKRLYKKISFIVILLTVIVLSVMMNIASKQDNGILKIGIVLKNPEDKLAVEISKELLDKKSIINFLGFDKEEKATKAVRNGKIDSLWIFPDDINKSIKKYLDKKEPIVKCIDKEESVFLRLAKEKLYSVLFPYVSHQNYINYMNKNMGTENADLKVLNEYYEESFISGELFRVGYENSNKKIEDANYLTSPLRGILASLILLCAFSAVMYFKKDKQIGMFARISADKHILIELAYVFIAVFNSAIFVMLAIYFSGLFCGIGIELLSMMIYILMCTGFSVLFGEIFKKTSVLGAVIPSIMLIMIAVCPVFIDIKEFENVRKILPLNYYLNGSCQQEFLINSIIYMAVIFILCFAINLLKRKTKPIN